MQKIDRVVVPLRVLLVLVFIGLVVAQVMSLPGEFSQMARENPEAGFIPWLLLAFAIVEILCFQVVIVCTWRLLTLVRSDRIFSTATFAGVSPTRSANSPTLILRRASSTSMRTTIGIRSLLPGRCAAPSPAAGARATR
jgi:hypothetical protein